MAPLLTWLLTICAATVSAWTTEELSLFDLVEEINANFYQVLEVEPSATTQEIRKAYRRLSLQWHPDRIRDKDLDVPNSGDKFRQIAAVYDVLKDENLRKAYDEVLETGLPTWRQPIYYFRKVRKMPWYELVVLVGLLLTCGHYLVLWGSYFEKRLNVCMLEANRLQVRKEHGKLSLEYPVACWLDFTRPGKNYRKLSFFGKPEDAMSSYIRKREKRLKRKRVDIDQMISEEVSSATAVEKPGWMQLLPIVICKSTVSFFKSLPSMICSVRQSWSEAKRAKQEKLLEALRREEELKELEEFKQAKKLNKQAKAVAAKTVTFNAAESAELKPVVSGSRRKDSESENNTDDADTDDSDYFGNFVQSGDWPVEDVVSLIRLTQKIPIGTPKRWEKIAGQLRRRPNDVMKMFGNLKHLQMDEYQKLLRTVQEFGDSASIGNEAAPSTELLNAYSNHNRSSAPFDDDDSGRLPPDSAASVVSSTSKNHFGVIASSTGASVGWSSSQQKLFEQALVQFPKGTPERWENIASCVPPKSKEDCIARYKELVEVVKLKKNELSADSK